MTDLYVGQKLRHYNIANDEMIITLYSIYRIAAGKITLQLLDSTNTLLAKDSFITINDFTVFNMLDSGNFEIINEQFEIET